MELQVNPLSTGTIVKIYNANRGQDYVVLGFSKRYNKMLLAKNTCILNDGGVYEKSKIYSLDVDCMFNKTDPFYFVPKVKRVSGHRTLNETSVKNWIAKQDSTDDVMSQALKTFEVLKYRDEVFPPLDAPDIKKVINY